MASADDRKSMHRDPRAVRFTDWSTPGKPWFGRVEGPALDTGASLIFYCTDEIGRGPDLHVHPYDEIFVINEGRAEFTIGNQRIVGEAGDVLMGPADVPHKYKSLGPGRLLTTDIHLSDRIIQTDLPDPDNN